MWNRSKKWTFLGVAVVVAGGFTLSGCGQDDAGEATVSLAFKNTAASLLARTARATTLATSAAPSAFSMKLIAAYVTEDIDPDTQNNVGTTAIFYLNEQCEDDIMHCDIEGGTAEDGNPMDKVVTTFFDLSSPEAVNTELNSQGRGVSAGTYKYARLEFCKYATGTDPNIKWSYGSLGEQTFRRTMCSVNSAVMDPPLELAEGDTATITLEYDLASAVQVGADASGDTCTGTDADKTCFTMPTFTPSAAKE
jgi:hypothetical protein